MAMKIAKENLLRIHDPIKKKEHALPFSGYLCSCFLQLHVFFFHLDEDGEERDELIISYVCVCDIYTLYACSGM